MYTWSIILDAHVIQINHVIYALYMLRCLIFGYGIVKQRAQKTGTRYVHLSEAKTQDLNVL